MAELSPWELAGTAWAFATAVQWDPVLFVVLVKAAGRRLDEFSVALDEK